MVVAAAVVELVGIQRAPMVLLKIYIDADALILLRGISARVPHVAPMSASKRPRCSVHASGVAPSPRRPTQRTEYVCVVYEWLPAFHPCRVASVYGLVPHEARLERVLSSESTLGVRRRDTCDAQHLTPT